jgi:hypothetical protein
VVAVEEGLVVAVPEGDNLPGPCFFDFQEKGGKGVACASIFLESATLELSIEAFSDTRVMAKKKHKKDKKLHN